MRKNSTYKPQLVLLIYDPRSGSTFLASELDKFKDISVSLETYFLQNIVYQDDEKKRHNSLELIESLKERDGRFENFIQHGYSLQECLESQDAFSPESFTRCVLASHFGAQNNADVWIVKCGIAGWHIEQIATKLPSMKFIHIVRDGRAVLNSKLKTKRVYTKGTMASDALAPALKWVSWLRHIDRFSSHFSERIIEVRYEDLVQQPQDVCGRIRQFLGLSGFGNTASSALYSNRIPDKEKALHANVAKVPVKDNVTKWKKGLSKGDVILFEYFAYDMLHKKGYRPLYLQNKMFPFYSLSFIGAFFRSLVAIFRRKVSSKAQKIMSFVVD